MKHHLPLRIATGTGLGLGLLILALWLAWQALVPVNFGYGLAYRLLDIGQHVQHYGPQNRYKHGFASTSPAQQQFLFGEIVAAIQQQGEGLRQIRYTTADGQTFPLLREAEVVHLQDVANLVSLSNRITLVTALILSGLVIGLKRRNLPAPSIPQMLAGLGGLLGLGGAILLLAGPTNAFYWLHTRIFPPEHEWFFYYQDSLMTTLMKAPDLFGFVAALWIGLALVILGLGHAILARWLKGKADSSKK